LSRAIAAGSREELPTALTRAGSGLVAAEDAADPMKASRVAAKDARKRGLCMGLPFSMRYRIVGPRTWEHYRHHCPAAVPRRGNLVLAKL
jgi:hypothetical protein